MPIIEPINLGTGFKKYFNICTASTDSLLGDVFHIRHEVYCESLKFEAVRADQRETDHCDAHSVHCLLRKVDEPFEPVGCTRLVLTNPEQPDELLPFEKTCGALLDRSIVDPSRLARGRIAEISRLAVRGQYRRRKGEEHEHATINGSDFSTGAQPRFPYIPTSLLLGAVALAERQQIETVFVLTEPRLAAHFAKLGVEVIQIGAPISHRGTRIPSMMRTEEIIRNMRSLLLPLWRVVREEIDRSFDEQSKT